MKVFSSIFATRLPNPVGIFVKKTVLTKALNNIDIWEQLEGSRWDGVTFECTVSQEEWGHCLNLETTSRGQTSSSKINSGYIIYGL